MNKTNEFNQNLYYLGATCKYNHVFLNTNCSLRQRSNRTCIECQKNIKQKYKQSNLEICNERIRCWRKKVALETNKNLPSIKRCVVCLEWKITNEFYVEKYSANGLLGHCISCDKKRQKSYRAKHRKLKVPKNPELTKQKIRETKKRYKKSVKGKLAGTLAHHRRKANLMKVESQNYTPTQLLVRFAEFNNQCAYCGSNEKIIIDHFIPISKLGADKIENIVTACIKCNSSKNNKNPKLWFELQIFFSSEKWQSLIKKIER